MEGIKSVGECLKAKNNMTEIKVTKNHEEFLEVADEQINQAVKESKVNPYQAQQIKELIRWNPWKLFLKIFWSFLKGQPKRQFKEIEKGP